MSASISVHRRNDLLIVRCIGDFDLASRGLLSEVSTAVLKEHGSAVVDLGSASLFDCGSVRLLEHLIDESSPTPVVVACPAGVVRQVLSLTGFSASHEVVGRIDEAVARIGSPGGGSEHPTTS